MDFVDHTLVRLADESTRGVLFDDSALTGTLAAAYDVSAVAPVAPYRAVFDELTLGVASASFAASPPSLFAPASTSAAR